MNWFKTIWLTSDERKALKKSKEKVEELLPEVHALVAYETPYKNIIYSQFGITVVFKDGSSVQKIGGDSVLYNAVKSARTQKEIEDLFVDTSTVPASTKEDSDQVETKEERELVSQNLGVFKGNEDFIVRGDQVFLKGVKLALPVVVASTFIEILEKQDNWHKENTPFDNDKHYDGELDNLEDQYQALKMFWLKLALNSLPQSREDTLVFVKNNDVRITRNGNLVLYRRIVSKNKTGDQSLIAFVSQQYYRIKKKHKKSPSDFYVWDNGGVLELRRNKKKDKTAKFHGALDKLYRRLGSFDDNDYTSAHNSGKHKIKIGSIYEIDKKDINLDNGLCAAGGLHAAAVNYDYSGFGDVPIVVLVNPSKAITVPRHETGKLRTIEMFIACINDKPHGVHWDEDAISAFDEEYHDLTIEQLEEALENKSFADFSVEGNLPDVSLSDIKTITEMLQDRVSKVI